MLAIGIGIASCVAMIVSVLFFPQIKIKKLKLDSYWVVVLLGAILLISLGGIDLKYLGSELIKDSSMNPIKILILFITMTVLSVFLDEIGFFSYLASRTLKLAKNSQKKLFVWLYVIVSILTVFTSNDIIVLTFTPFICYFAKNAKINPLPYLVTEFVAANTMSMTLIIGNPTNIYIATSYGVSFIDYFKVMFIPTMFAALVSFALLYLLFRKSLQKTAEGTAELVAIKDKVLLIIGLVHLSACTIILAISSFVEIEMWLVSLISALSLLLIVTVYCLIKRKKPVEMGLTLKRAPWQLIPFVLSMFTIILALQANSVTELISKFLGEKNAVFKYGALSFLSANVINNIPMSVFFCSVIAPLQGVAQIQAIYATIIGSNLGAILTPIGALAGIMWSSLLKTHEVKYSYLDFVKYGVVISIPSLIVTLLALIIIL
ncbi:MAG: hypothetical protein IKZ38_01735 [Clostridia bacterium]|nr:hypothetical protein [Clostridia bacterium]